MAMRSARMLGSVLLMLLVGSVSAQPTTATVKQPGAEVRSGPSVAPLHYTTNQLGPGEPVEVVKEEADGWLAIKPPPGSFSWINKRFLRQLGKNVWSVESEVPVEVLFGSAMRQEKPIAISARVERGTLVESIGQPLTTPDDGIWLPIKPPPTEVRYVRAADVTRNGARTANASPGLAAPQAASPVPQAWNGSAVPLVPSPSAERQQGGPQPASNPRWIEAERAEKEGRIKEAIDSYYLLGREVANTDHELSMRCFNQAAALQRRGGYTVETRLRPVAAGAPGVALAAPQACCVPCGQNEYVFRGRLREAYQSLDHKRTFALENSQGQIVAYVTSTGANLESYLGRVVEVGGAACYRGDLRSNYVRASRITPLP
jgi:hypothetical protein